VKDILQRLKELKTERLVSRIKHLRGRHDQRDHNRWPAGYQAQGYIPVGGGRRAGLLSSRATGGLAGLTQTNIMMNQTKRIPPKVKTGTPSDFAPMPIDTSEFQPGGFVYQYMTQLLPAYNASKIATDDFGNDSDLVKEFRNNFTNIFGSYGDGSDEEYNPGWIRVLEKKIGMQQKMEIRDDIKPESLGYAQSRIESFNNAFIKLKEKNEEINLLSEQINSYTDTKMNINNLPRNDYLDLIEPLKNFENALDAVSNYASNEAEDNIRKMIWPDQKTRGEILNEELINAENVLREKIQEKLKNEQKTDEDINSIRNIISLRQDLRELQKEKDSLQQDAEYHFENAIKYAKINNPFTELKLEAKQMRKKNIFRFLMPRNDNDFMLTSEVSSLLYTDNLDYIQSQMQEFMDFITKTTDTIKNVVGDDLSVLEDMVYGELDTQVNLEITVDELDFGLQNIAESIRTIVEKFNQAKSQVESDSYDEANVIEAMNSFFNSSLTLDKVIAAKQIQRALSFVYDAQSFNGTPTVVSWSEIINPTTNVQTDENENPVVHWRSVKGVSNQDPEGIDRGMQYVEQMRTGETHYPGTGVSGYGTYMKTSNIYGNNFNENESVSFEERFERIKRDINDTEAVFNQMKSILKDEKFDIPDYVTSGFMSKMESFFENTKKDIGDVDGNNKNVQDMIDSMTKMLEDGFKYPHPMGILKNLQESLSEIDVPKEQRIKMTRLKSLFNELYNKLAVMRSNKKEISTSEARYADLKTTRVLYGDYTAGYTINSDARIPMGAVNGYNKGNHGHYSFVSLDKEIDSEFKERYPMLDPKMINIGVKMAMLGYDMYRAHVNDYSTNIVVLNRAILNMSEDTIEKGASDDDIQNIVNIK